MRRFPCKRARGLLLAGMMTLAPSSVRADGYARTHTWIQEHGNLIANWSFENRLETWGDSAANGLSADPRHAFPGGEAFSGAFVGRVSGSASAATLTALLGTGLLEVVPGQTYTLSFLVRSDGDLAGGGAPAVRMWSSRVMPETDILGSSYRNFAFSSTGTHGLSSWTLYRMHFTVPGSGRPYLSIHLWRSAEAGAGGTLFFDDVTLEEGNIPAEEIEARHAARGYSVAFSDHFDRMHQRQTRVPAHSAHYLAEGTLYDSAGRPVLLPLAVPLNRPAPVFEPDLPAAANAYFEGAAGYAFSELQYADEPGARVTKRSAPGEPWRLSGPRTTEAGFYFTNDLGTPANPATPAVDPGERAYLLEWRRDEDSAFTLAWMDRKGQLVQTARGADGAWAVTRMEYFPAGQVRRLLTPLDVAASGDGFAEIRNYNAQGLLTSSYSRDRGLWKFWYNRRGMLRYSQDDRQRERSPHLFTYRDYDAFGNLLSTGEQILYHPDQESVVDGNGGSYPWGKLESRGFLYGSVDGFEERTGIPLDSLDPGLKALPAVPGARIAAWHRNPESAAPGLSPAQRLVADFVRHDAAGRVHRRHKYMGALAESPLQTAEYRYDTLGRLRESMVHEGFSPTSPLMIQGYARDALGRISAVAGLYGDTLARYSRAYDGSLASVWLGEESRGPGLEIHYDYHVRGWTKGSRASEQAGGKPLYRQALGYEEKALGEAGVPPLLRARHTGRIAQQVYWYSGEIGDPLRMANYGYDGFGNLVEADHRHAQPDFDSGGDPVFPVSFQDSDALDTRTAYDANGRILGRRSGGVSAADSAVYHYHEHSHRLESVSGRLSPGRDASAANSFGYDAAGRMVRDRSKQLDISYGHDGMPVEFGVASGASETSLHPLYDADGVRVSQIVLTRPARQFPVYWIGRAQGAEAPGTYTAATIGDAWNDANYRLNFLYHPADTIFLHVVADSGAADADLDVPELAPFSGPHGPVPVVVRGVRKYSPAYDTLMAWRSGRLAEGRHFVRLGDRITSEVRETYGPDGLPVERSVAATVYGRTAPIGRYVDGEYQFYLKNHQGSVMRVVRSDGGHTGTAAFDYQAYGEAQRIRGDSVHPVEPRYTGKEVEALLGLYDFGARWYDPGLGLWLAPDPAGQFPNPYGFGGDPVNFIDPDGLWSVGIGVVVGYNRDRGWHAGIGVAADFQQEIGWGVNLSWVRNGDGTSTATVGAGYNIDLLIVSNNAGAGYTYNTRDGHQVGGFFGGSALGLGEEVGGSLAWSRSGKFLGGSVYAEVYLGSSTFHSGIGYEQGFGSVEGRGMFWNARIGPTQGGYGYNGGWSYSLQGNIPLASYDSRANPATPLSAVPTQPGARPSGKWLSPAYFGSNYLGPGGVDGAPATSDVDVAGFLHDADYTACGAAGVRSALFDSRPDVLRADWRLAGRSLAALGRYGLLRGNGYVDAPVDGMTLGASIGVGLVFTALATHKTATQYTFYY